jgi:hypothetical protein
MSLWNHYQFGINYSSYRSFVMMMDVLSNYTISPQMPEERIHSQFLEWYETTGKSKYDRMNKQRGIEETDCYFPTGFSYSHLLELVCGLQSVFGPLGLQYFSLDSESYYQMMIAGDPFNHSVKVSCNFVSDLTELIGSANDLLQRVMDTVVLVSRGCIKDASM